VGSTWAALALGSATCLRSRSCAVRVPGSRGIDGWGPMHPRASHRAQARSACSWGPGWGGTRRSPNPRKAARRPGGQPELVGKVQVPEHAVQELGASLEQESIGVAAFRTEMGCGQVVSEDMEPVAWTP